MNTLRQIVSAILCLLLLTVCTGFGQTPSLVKDGMGTWFFGGFNGWFTNVNGTLFFNATVFDSSDFSFREALWKSDGTDAGTVVVKQIFPGGSSGLKEFVNLNGTLFFQANDGTHGYELWKSDGTDAGTVMVKDIWPGSTSSIGKIYIAYNGNVYFSASDGAGSGYELWKSDGTDAGTVMVKDINPGAAHGGPGNPVISNGTLFFAATTAANGLELWKSDGTETGTVLVKDINTGTNNSGNSNVGNLTDVNGITFFTVTNSVVGGTTYVGYQLWKTDGTAAGTVLVKGPLFSNPPVPSWFTNVNGTLFFSALTGPNGTELWKSDGTTDGTVLVGDNLAAASSPAYLTNVNGTVFFSRYVDASIGTELWKTDGTDAGTVMVKDINPGASSSGPTHLTNVNGTLFFWATDGITYGTEFWKSDGTDAGTVMVQDFNPGTGSSGGFPLTNVNGTWFFVAFPGLWKLVAVPASVELKDGALPSTFMLNQNYPNPFNPSTKISFDIQVAGFTKLKVYDFLGREVQGLVNEKLETGSYEIEFDAGHLPSGVYFYKLTSGSFTSIKKMLFMK